jgi:cytochrome P450 family 6
LEGLTFLIWGFEISGCALSFALYELALHPQIQHSLRAEMLQVLCKHDGKQTHDVIKNMAYLDRVVSDEKLREFKQ